MCKNEVNLIQINACCEWSSNAWYPSDFVIQPKDLLILKSSELS